MPEIKSNRTYQLFMTFFTLFALVPFIFWFLNPTAVLSDPVGEVFEAAAKTLYVFTDLPQSPGTSDILHLLGYILLICFAFGASILVMILTWRCSNRTDARFLSLSLTGVIFFSGFH